MNLVLTPLAIIAVLIGVIAIPFLVGVVLYNVVRLVFLLVSRLVALISGVVLDVVRLAGHVVSLVLHIPLVILSALFFRFDRVGQHATALGQEAGGIGKTIASVLVMRPLRFIGLVGPAATPEPKAMPAEPASDFVFEADFGHGEESTAKPGEFEGYKIVGNLPRGGSGARLFIAEPTGTKATTLARLAGGPVDRVVIKAFSLDDGSTMPQIVRESRALEAARDLGLVFEHQLDGSRFHYVMPYVPGDDLATVTRDLHHDSGDAGLNACSLRAALNYFSELLVTLERFHHKGLWHKDIKPSNVIVSKGRVHLVDLGLVTPLRSAMTLTTHGTEYFRDPEMVRLAMQGVKVHEVDGVKFDLYSSGALLYSMLENSFPAHGSLSRFSRRVPEALQWVVRRAMADMHKRYGSAGEMLADLESILSSENPYALKPSALPSMQGRCLHFKSWEAGNAGASYRVHGFEDRHGQRGPISEQLNRVDKQFRRVGDRAHEAGERVRSQMERASRRFERKMSRKSARIQERAHARADRHAAGRGQRRSRVGGLLVVGLLLFFGVAAVGALFVGASQSDGPTTWASTQTTWSSNSASPSVHIGTGVDPDVEFVSYGGASAPIRVTRQTMPQVRSTPGSNHLEYVYEVRDRDGRASRIISDHALHNVDDLDCQDLPPGVHLSSDPETQSAHQGHGGQASGLQIVPAHQPQMALRAITSARELGHLQELGEGQHILVLNDLSKSESAPLRASLEDLPVQLVGVGSLPDDIEVLALAKSLVGFAGPSDEGALASLADFVSERDDLDAVYWMGRGADGNQVVGRLVMGN